MSSLTDVDEFNRYKVGIEDRVIDLSKEVYKNMLHLVAYDIREPSRLRKVAKICEDYGLRVEYSVFECDLTEELFMRMWADLSEVIDEDDDSLLAYRICGSCVQNIVSGGIIVRPGKPLLYII